MICEVDSQWSYLKCRLWNYFRSSASSAVELSYQTFSPRFIIRPKFLQSRKNAAQNSTSGKQNSNDCVTSVTRWSERSFRKKKTLQQHVVCGKMRWLVIEWVFRVCVVQLRQLPDQSLVVEFQAASIVVNFFRLVASCHTERLLFGFFTPIHRQLFLGHQVEWTLRQHRNIFQVFFYFLSKPPIRCHVSFLPSEEVLV